MCEQQTQEEGMEVKEGALLDKNLKFATKTLQDYEVISVIGNGSFGTCYKVRDKETGELFAWKGIDYDELNEAKKANLVSEINVLRQLQHPNIVQYYHHLVNHEAKSIFIVMECCEGGDLAQLINKARLESKRFEEKYIWRVLFQVCKALQLCHNKIKEGSILHRDIKPANIFLDADGNAKLGDFGLARVLRKNESFAQSFVGTPYYMSPEIVKGAKYDRKSDVWAAGCLIYEMCALRPPFKGREFQQLSANISNGKFTCIPEVYSKDLQEVIAFMLEVENEQRPSIEVIIRHPVVVRNITDLGEEFPKLVPAEAEFYVVSDFLSEARCKLQYPDLSSTMHTEQYSFNVGYGQRCLSITGIFTPDLKTELFYSAKRKIFPKNTFLQQSDPELYESIKREDYAIVNDSTSLKLPAIPSRISDFFEPDNEISPSTLTQNVFDKTLQARLNAIRAQESLLKHREACLNLKEKELNEKEKRLLKMEHQLQEQKQSLENKTKYLTPLPKLERARIPLPTEEINGEPVVPPPIPPRKGVKHDETYCSIEPNDSLLQEPTVAKLNLATLPAPKAFPSLRKVTFQSPKKFISYDIETSSQQAKQATATNSQPNSNQMQMSISSKGSDESSESHHSQQNKRKSILSIFGLSRNNKDPTKMATNSSSNQSNSKNSLTSNNQQPGITPKDTLQLTSILKPEPKEVLAKCETSELSTIWTKQNKRAAFDLLAAMNAAERHGVSISNGEMFKRHGGIPASSRHKLRQSVRGERSSSNLQRNRLRRSLIVGSSQIPTAFSATREQIVV